MEIDKIHRTVYRDSFYLYSILQYLQVAVEMHPRVIRKIALVGDVRVGKTSIFSRFLRNAFSDSYSETIGVNIGKKPMNTGNDQVEMTLMVWDVFGSHLHGEVRRLALENVDAVIIISDVTNENSWKSAVDFWLPSIAETVDTSFIYFSLNKVDLISGDRYEEAVSSFISLAARYGANITKDKIFLTSSKEAYGVNEIFESVSVALTNLPETDIPRRSKPDSHKTQGKEEKTLEAVFDRIVMDVLNLFDEKSQAQEILQECYKESSLDSEDIIPEELDEFMRIVSDKLLENNISPSKILRISGEWKRLKSQV